MKTIFTLLIFCLATASYGQNVSVGQYATYDSLSIRTVVGSQNFGGNINVKPNVTSTDGSQYYAAGKMQVYGTVVTGVGQLYPAIIFGRDGRGAPRITSYNGKLIVSGNNPEPGQFYEPFYMDLKVRNLEVTGSVIQPNITASTPPIWPVYATMAEAKSKGKLKVGEIFKTRTGTVKQVY